MSITIVHVEDRFNPLTGYQVNFLLKSESNFNKKIITSNSFSIWNFTNIAEQNNIDKKFEDDYNVEIIRLKAKLAKKNKNHVWINGLVNKLKDINPDIIFVHCIESYSAFRIILNKKLRKSSLIVTDTHNLYNQFSDSLKFKIYLWFIRNVIAKTIKKNNIRCFYTVEENRKILQDEYNISENVISDLHIGTDLKLFYHNTETRNLLRKKYLISDNSTVLIYTGKINSIKEPHLIFKAIKTIENEVTKPLVLFFLGSIDQQYCNEFFPPEFNNNLITFIQESHKPNNELFGYYSMADFAVFPKHNTLSSLDAQACKLPVIMESDITNNSRLKKGGETFTKGNFNELGKLILELINNENKRKELGLNGYEYVKQAFDYFVIRKQFEEKILKLYNEKYNNTISAR